MLVSVILKILNEEDNIADILDSLVIQEGPIEVIVVDADSEDRTQEIVQQYADEYPFIKLYIKPGSRGVSLNFGLGKATGEIIALTDGDCIANPNWVKEIRRSITEGADMVAGKTINIGLKAWEELDRVELFHRGFDCSWPGCNLGFRKEVIDEAGGVDPWFITAEDIDLNYRVIGAGHRLVHNPNAIIYNRTRATVYGFFHQAFWNGAGRKQLTLKHGRLWGNYDPLKMFKQRMTFWALVRLAFALLGYVGFKLFGDKEPYGK